MAAQPDATLKELKEKLGLEMSLVTLYRALLALKMTFKKVLRAAEQDRPDVAQKRCNWRGWQGVLKPEDARRFVFIDVTWASTNICRPCGRGPRGERVIAAVPHGHWKTTTFVAALRHDRLTAPVVVDGAMNGPTFLA